MSLSVEDVRQRLEIGEKYYEMWEHALARAFRRWRG